MTGSNTITQGIKMWTDESVDYTPATPNYRCAFSLAFFVCFADGVCSHFTQVVWKATTQLGCAVASCSGIFPASYGPANYYVCEVRSSPLAISHSLTLLVYSTTLPATSTPPPTSVRPPPSG